MGTRTRKTGFTEAVAPRPKTQTEWKRRTRSLSFSDARAAVEWLNATRGQPAYRRVLAIRQELEELGGALDRVRQARRTAARQKRPRTDEEILRASGELLAAGEMQEQFRERHNAMNQRLAQYAHIPALACNLDSGIWRFGMVPRQSRGPEVTIEDQAGSIRVDEATAVAALCRLAANRELHKVRLCEQCGQQWRISERAMDRFCSQKCRESFHANSPEYHERKAASQRGYRLRKKAGVDAGAHAFMGRADNPRKAKGERNGKD